MDSGHGCLGCAEPNFWDKAGGFYAPLSAAELAELKAEDSQIFDRRQSAGWQPRNLHNWRLKRSLQERDSHYAEDCC
jgi:hydrogenase small subunit